MAVGFLWLSWRIVNMAVGFFWLSWRIRVFVILHIPKMEKFSNSS